MSAPTGHLLMLSLGPIQDFIHAARRCQDLWFGSWLLSDLARTVGEVVAGQGATVVFPTRPDSTPAGAEPPGVANILLAELPAGVVPADVATEAQRAMMERLRAVRDWAWYGLDGVQAPDNGPVIFQRNVAELQVNDLMELLWVAVPCPEDGYAAARDAAVAAMAGIKSTRTWTQPPWKPGPGIPKSSLDGDRESVLHEKAWAPVRQGGLTADDRRALFGTKGGERLCGVGLLKRLGSSREPGNRHFPERDWPFRHGRPVFHSTPHVAMAPTCERLAGHPDAVRAWIDELRGCGVRVNRHLLPAQAAEGPPGLVVQDEVRPLIYDGVLLMDSRIPELLEERSADDQGRFPSAQVLPRLRAALRKLLRDTDGPAEPCPYYAFLLADGDNMGAAIDALRSLKGHQALGAALNDFAGACRGIVAAHQGTLIFAGGDDVLALLPLHTAIACARALHEAFHEKVEQRLQQIDREPLPTGGRKPASLSVGIGISHCREPMSEARALAGRAEKAAKQVKDKNALCVMVDKRSGGELVVTGRWVGARQPDRALEAWVGVLEADGLAAKTAHDLEEVAGHYQSLPLHDQVARRDEICALAQQVVARKRRRGGDGDKSATAAEKLDARILSVATADAPVAEVLQLSAELQLARLICRARRDAGLAPEPTA